MGTVAVVAASLAIAKIQGDAEIGQAKYKQSVANANSRLANLQAQDATDRGESNASDQLKKTKQLISSQRAALAAQGLDINQGSAKDVQDESAMLGAQDALTIRNNAAMEAWGFRSQADNFKFEGQAGVLAAENSARNSLISGGLNAYSAMGGFSSTPKPTVTSSYASGFKGSYRAMP